MVYLALDQKWRVPPVFQRRLHRCNSMIIFSILWVVSSGFFFLISFLCFLVPVDGGDLKGLAGQKGQKSIATTLEMTNIIRFRLGVGEPPSGSPITIPQWIFGHFGREGKEMVKTNLNPMLSSRNSLYDTLSNNFYKVFFVSRVCSHSWWNTLAKHYWTSSRSTTSSCAVKSFQSRIRFLPGFCRQNRSSALFASRACEVVAKWIKRSCSPRYRFTPNVIFLFPGVNLQVSKPSWVPGW